MSGFAEGAADRRCDRLEIRVNSELPVDRTLRHTHASPSLRRASAWTRAALVAPERTFPDLGVVNSPVGVAHTRTSDPARSLCQ
ncbi:hypothetical protein AYO39_01080 [Actinobacteria bacterium SCGC AG-212-D09]|nr:hypothetical protein AYO39_01080 [Actinobacteria bacterium SCGC AG-212-D09]